MVPIHQAKARLSKLIARACAGESVVISRDKKPVVKLVPVQPPSGRKFGAMRGRAKTGDAFFEPLPAHELDLWRQ
jgi:prevent-host-death family protein